MRSQTVGLNRHAHAKKKKKKVFHVILMIKSSFSKCHFSVYTEEGNLSKYLIFITFFTAMENGNHLKGQATSTQWNILQLLIFFLHKSIFFHKKYLKESNNLGLLFLCIL